MADTFLVAVLCFVFGFVLCDLLTPSHCPKCVEHHKEKCMPISVGGLDSRYCQACLAYHAVRCDPK